MDQKVIFTIQILHTVESEPILTVILADKTSLGNVLCMFNQIQPQHLLAPSPPGGLPQKLYSSIYAEYLWREIKPNLISFLKQEARRKKLFCDKC